MSGARHAHGLGSRWPVVLTVLAVFGTLVVLPARVRLGPPWGPYAVGIAMLVPMLGVALTDGRRAWLRLERAVTLVVAPITGIAMVAGLGIVVRAMVLKDPTFDALVLLSSGVALWITNILVFSLLYWQVDRGGPAARADHAEIAPDWQFASTGAPDSAPPAARPVFVDYLALGFTTATAFSPTDVLPLTPRAKLLMMLEGTISLVTTMVVAARAINIMGD